ncbi:MAG: urease accessory protein UreD [Bradyrhizobium sp.]|uniref:urease accessory protein UreD n=1 Tax=Bradyrhizobium sp. TaxID=376 RepID=UPI0029A9DABA|nr:urease accessory protein UreD [Bradyrhizobium sp.]MDX3965486.1 urease accessory protein UreD [Bradyrhizobium sp.]
MNNATASDAARLDLSFVRRSGRTVIDRRMFAWPFVLTRSFRVDPDRPDCLSVIVQTASGAVHGEDSLAQRLMLGPGTAVCLTNQGATSVHRAHPSARAVETVKLDVASNASLEYLPEPRIMFPDAALSQTIELDCATDAHALIFDAFTMHDPCGGARYFRELESTFCLRRSGGEPLLMERTRLFRPDRRIFCGYGAFGSVFIVLPPTHDLRKLQGKLTAALERIKGLYGAVSASPAQAGLAIRLAALDLRYIRLAFENIKLIYREAIMDQLRSENLSATG